MERVNFIKTVLAGGASILLPSKALVEDLGKEEMHPLNPGPAIKLLLEQYKMYEGTTSLQKESIKWYLENIDDIQNALDTFLFSVDRGGKLIAEPLLSALETYPNKVPLGFYPHGTTPISYLTLNPLLNKIMSIDRVYYAKVRDFAFNINI